MPSLVQPLLSSSVLRRVERSALPPAVVVGTDVTGLTEARALARHGVVVLGIDEKRHRYSSYSGSFTFIPCNAFHGPGFVSFMARLAEELPVRAALFLSMDEHVKHVAREGQHLQSLYHLEYPSNEAVSLLMSKREFAAKALEKGWPVPRTFTCASHADVRQAAGAVVFPAILKPEVKQLAFRENAPAKVFRCETTAELLKAYDLVAQWEPQVVVQEWVPGTDSDIYFSFHYFDRRLNEIASFEGRKIRQYIPECGNTAMAIGVETAQVTALSREILQTCECVGFGGVEYKRDPRNGRFLIMEPTVGRVDLQVGVAIANGVDIVSRAYFHLIGRPYPGAEPVTWKRKWIMAASDFRSARLYMRRGELTWADYLRSVRGPKQFAVWRIGDYRMMLGFLWIWGTAPVRLLRRLRRLLPVPSPHAGVRR